MRSARMILATAAASAVLAITAPGAYAADGDWEKGDSSYSKEDSGYSKEHGKEDSGYSKEHGKEDSGYGKEHGKDSGYGKPHGGVHTGGGALTAVNDSHDKGSKDWSKEDGGKEDSWSKEDGGKEDSWSKDDSSWSGKDKPHGGMHTGGGALAAPAVTAGGLAVLAVAGAGLYSARRKKSAHGLA
ncbi:hypothetical protein ACIBVL_16050 [Streptomyces sp. NPDC049687]|uniref:hypothetical protein n=1 Tax=Streptomyces sp. NPDC049687 TaxID=3365596 RepID=UPI0037B60C79